MVTFYRKQECRPCAAIEETMDEMVLRHTTIVVENEKELPENIRNEPLPVLVDENEDFEGPKAILNHLEEVREFKQRWDRYSDGDSSYVEEGGGPSGGASYDL